MYYFIIAICVVLITYLLFIKPRKNSIMNKVSFSEAVNPVEFRMAQELKERGYKVTDFRRLINDKGQGIVVAYDSVKDFLAVGMLDSTVMGSGAELKNVEKVLVPKEKGIGYLSSSIRFTLGEETYTYEISSTPYNPKGPVGRIVTEITEDFLSILKMVEAKER